MTDSANDGFYDLRRQLRSLDEEKAVSLASAYVDQNCAELDAQFLKQVIVAGSESPEVTRRFAAMGSPAAQAVFGTALLHGQFVEKSAPQGLFWLRRAHNNGNTRASILLGSAYLDGSTLPRDAVKGAAYIAGAAEAGDPAAQYIYANLLVDGDGVVQDEQQGLVWLRRSAAAGYGLSIDLLAANGIPLAD